MRFLMLGSLMLSTDAGPSVVGGRGEQSVLAVLLLHPNLTVSVDRLVNAAWAVCPPKSARTQVAISVSKLRRRFESTGLGGTMLATDPHGYRIQVAEEDLDVQFFAREASLGRSRAAEGRLEDASVNFRNALSLWRGRPFEGLDGSFLRTAAENLCEEQLTVIEQCSTVELELGRHKQLIGELRPLVAEYPLREGLAAQLMIALYRDDRQAEALDVFRRVRQHLVEEMGLEPGDQLRKVQHAILQQDLSLAPPGKVVVGDAAWLADKVVPRQLPATIADFTGRAAELAALGVLAQPATRSAELGVVPTTVIAGAGGTGKTALAVHAAHQLLARYPDGQLFVDLRGASANPSDPADVLEEFLRVLGCPDGAIPTTLDARAARLRSILAGRRMLIVLDNALGEGQVTPLLPGTASCTVLITSRIRLAGLPGAKLVELEPLPTDAAVTLLSRIVGEQRTAMEAETTAELVALCDGLPLALRIAGSRLAARPWWRMADLVRRLADERFRLDELTYGTMAVRSSLALSYAGLSHRAKQLFHRLGWLDVPHTAAWVSAALIEVDLHVAEETLARLVDVNLLRVSVSDTTGVFRYDFHDLVQVFAAEMAVAGESGAQLRAAAERALQFLAPSGLVPAAK